MNQDVRIGVGDFYGGVPFPKNPALNFVGSTDVNRDGFADLIWRNDTSGVLDVWYLRGAERLGYARLNEFVYMTAYPNQWRMTAF